MSRIVCLSHLAIAALVAVTLLPVATVADAALTTGACLVEKRAAWTNLRKCEGTQQVKQLKGKPADLPKCRAAFPFAGHTEWRLPSVLELRSILETTVPGCRPTAVDVHYSATRRPIELGQAWVVVFSDGVVAWESDGSRYYVGGVRSGL